MRVVLTLLLVVHGLIHLMGFAKAFGLAELAQLREPIAKPLGLVWLLAGLALLVSAWLPARSFWMVGALALVLSQLAICTAWPDAKYGSAVNVLLLIAVAYAFVSHGPFSMGAQYREDRAALLSQRAAPALVSEADLAALPPPVQRYLRVSGALGQPRVHNVQALWRGRMRGAHTEPWMSFEAKQLNTWSHMPERLYFMSARKKGLPVAVFHRFLAHDASFRVRLLSLFPLIDARGPELNRAETVTILNDLFVLAPAAVLNSAITFQSLDAQRAAVSFTRAGETVRAELHFNAAGELTSFISDDRLRASADGKHFVRQRWSTPLSDYRTFGPLRLASRAQSIWHAPDGDLVYGEFELRDARNNVER